MSRPQDRIDPPDPAPGPPGQPAWPTPPEPGIVPTPRAVFDPARPVPERPVWLLIGGALVCLAVAGAGLTWWQTAARQHVVTRGQFDGVQALEMRDLGSNAVVVRGSDRSDVSVTRRLTWVGGFGDQPPASEQFSGATLLVDNPCVGRSWCSVDYTVEVPRSVTVTVSVGSADVVARDVAALRVTAGSGRVEASDVAALDVRTGSGDIDVCRVGSAAGVVRLRAGSGDVTACAVAGPAEVDTASGDVDMEMGVGAAAVRVTTNSGDARLRLPTDAAYDVRTDTRSGHRSVTAAHDPSATRTVTVTTTSGDITIG